MDSKKIGKLIAKRRKEKGMTQGELAERLSVSNKTISKWETGAGLPDISILVDLASVLDISVDDLLRGKENEVQSALYEKNFLIKKKYYKKYLRDHYFESKAYWLFDFIGIMSILGSFAFLSLQQYIHHYVDILSKSFIVLGIILILFPFILIFFKVIVFKEHEVFYTLKDNGIIYQENEEEIFYSFLQFKRIKYKDFILLKKDQKILFIDLNDLDQLENDIKETKIKKCSFLISLFTSVIGCSLLILQIGYFAVLKRFEFEYIHSMNQIIFNLIILCCLFINYCLIKKKNIKIQYVLTGCLGVIIISIFGLHSFQKTEEISSFSSNLKNRAVLKYDDDQHRLDIYHYTYLCFARKSDTVATEINGYHGKWLTNDCYVFTYSNEENQRKVNVSTFGDRGDGISYFNIFPTLQGEWFNKNNGETKTYLKESTGQLTLKIKNKTQYFDASETKQNGTIALTLSKDEEAQYIIVLDENCILNDDNLLDKNGTIQVYNLQKDSSVTLYCGTYKEDKKEQEEIDNDYRKQAKELVNKMDAYLKKDSTLPRFDDRDTLFKVPSSSNDFYVVTRDAYFHSLKLFKQGGTQETGQIKQIKVLAGDINDFYVEMTYTPTITYLGETETMNITYKYRIKKGKDCYLVAFIGYRVPGDIGLVKCDPVIGKDVSTNEDYAYSVGG
ncbi:helix-turn-helix domain-containing protein [Faecalibacillus intestinalis]|uniref:helix-turn-helix domain-containing protein n=1 Tax=Faecalibacillus intestinalis TaxID=1982626 RepID=UPI00295E4572|nr:helix-turn-helix domain-containing protein [Faecalibacillus intestinalis]